MQNNLAAQHEFSFEPTPSIAPEDPSALSLVSTNYDEEPEPSSVDSSVDPSADSSSGISILPAVLPTPKITTTPLPPAKRIRLGFCTPSAGESTSATDSLEPPTESSPATPVASAKSAHAPPPYIVNGLKVYAPVDFRSVSTPSGMNWWGLENQLFADNIGMYVPDDIDKHVGGDLYKKLLLERKAQHLVTKRNELNYNYLSECEVEWKMHKKNTFEELKGGEGMVLDFAWWKQLLDNHIKGQKCLVEIQDKKDKYKKKKCGLQINVKVGRKVINDTVVLTGIKMGCEHHVKYYPVWVYGSPAQTL